MQSYFLTLVDKNQLTHDVWELVYSSEIPLPLIPGQFLLCDCHPDDTSRKRAYSVAGYDEKTVTFVIKKIPTGKGGSMAICDQEIGHTMRVMGPMGHFTLSDHDVPRVFIGTGTGFAPLYCMITGGGKSDKTHAVPTTFSHFLFGVRALVDVLYLDQLKGLRTNGVCDYEIFCSQESTSLPEKHYPGRVTQYITQAKIDGLNSMKTTEFYICGSPAMVSEVRSLLDQYGISRERIFFEQY